MIYNMNPFLATDWYKPSHISMYHEKSEFLQSNMTPRNDKLYPHFVDEVHHVMNAGLQGFVKWFFIDLFQNNFFNKPRHIAVDTLKSYADISIGLDSIDMSGIQAVYDLGYLPLEIRSLPEGSLSPIQVPVYSIQNTVPGFAWLVNFFESVMSSESWKTITTATTSFQYNKLCRQFASATCDNMDHVAFQCHMFAFRGEAGLADAAQSELGHLMSFFGTDTIPSIWYANEYYGMHGKFVAGSIPASEHSVATTNIGYIVGHLRSELPEASQDELRFLAEVEFLRKYITELYPEGFVSYVADSYDFWAIITQAAKILKPEIMARNGRVVFRPDSGIPEHIIAGYRIEEFLSYPDLQRSSIKSSTEVVYLVDRNKYYNVSGDRTINASIQQHHEITRHEAVGAIQCLWEIFGGTTNSKGYKVLDTHVGLIYGDSITVKRAKDIFTRLEEKGFASSNIVYGVGSFTTQYTTRDSLGFAVKATGAIIDGEEIMVTKEPKTDLKKKSAKGFVKVIKDADGNFKLVDNLSMEESSAPDNELRVIFRDGKMLVDETLETIRERVASHFQ